MLSSDGSFATAPTALLRSTSVASALKWPSWSTMRSPLLKDPIHASPLFNTAMPVTLTNTQWLGLRQSGSDESQLPCAASLRSPTGSGQMSIRFQNAACAGGSLAMFAALLGELAYNPVRCSEA